MDGVTCRVLLADPHRLVLEGLRLLLEPTHEIVGLVEDGEALVREASRLHPDLVFLEVQLPGRSGLDAARQVLSRCRGTRLAFLTSVEDAATAARAFAAGASGYLLKSDSGLQLRRALETIHRGRRWLSPAIAGGDPEALLSRLREPEGRGQPPGPRAREVIRLLAQGHSMKETAWRLGITPRTVAFHKYGAMQSLGIGSSAELVRHALEAGWLVGGNGCARESAHRERSRTVVTDPPGWLRADPLTSGERPTRQSLAGMDGVDASWRASCSPAFGSGKRPRRTRG